MIMSGIYQIRHLDSGKVYVGSAINLVKRWSIHRKALLRGKHYNPYLQAAWNKHGANRFVFEILEVVPSCNDLVTTEQEYMDEFQTTNREFGYNVAPTAGSLLGFKKSPETKAKMSSSLKNSKLARAQREKLYESRRGTKRSPETIAKISQALKGRKFSPEQRAKLSAIRKGKPHSPEHKAAILAAIRTPECRTKKSKTMTGRTVSPSAVAKMRAAQKGKVLSPKHRAKLSAAKQAANKSAREWIWSYP